jgi:hypothetical protein
VPVNKPRGKPRMRTVLLETQNPLDLTVAELKSFVRSLEIGPQPVKVVVGYEEQRGAGVTLWDVLHFWVPDADFLRDAMYGYLIGKCLDFMQNRRKRKHAENRRIAIVVHLPDGTEVDIVVDKVDGSLPEPEELRKKTRPRKMPSKRVDPDDDAEGVR